MLTSADLLTIQFAIRCRLDAEPGVSVALPIPMQAYGIGELYLDLDRQMYRQAEVPFIRVGVLARLGNSITTRSWFDLPDPFEHGHLLNEVDEIAEQYKQARKGFFLSPLMVPERKVKGTGLRGRWARYGG